MSASSSARAYSAQAPDDGDAEHVTDVKARGANAHEYLPVADPRSVDLPADEHLRPAVPLLDDCLHWALLVVSQRLLMA